MPPGERRLEVLLLGPGAPVRDVAALVEAEQPDLVALSTGQFWTAETSATALEFGADLVVHDPRALVALLHVRIPPPAADDR
jgi:hypothetical protein